MEVFRGNSKDPKFLSWLDKLTERKGNITVVIDNEISCHEARGLIQRNPSNRQYPWISASLTKALFHLITCDTQQCKKLLRDLNFKTS